MTLDQHDIPDTTQEIPFAVGSTALLRGSDEVVRVITVDGSDREVSRNASLDIWVRDDSGRLVRNREWVSVGALKSPATLAMPDPARVEVDEPVPIIAAKEIDLAQQRDDQAARIAALEQQVAQLTEQRNIEQADKAIFRQSMDLYEWAHDMARDYIVRLEGQRDVLSETLSQARATHQADMERYGHRQPSQTVKRKIETMSLRNPEMQALADLINEGWKVVFETTYVMGGYEEAYVTHFLRLEREVLETAHPPMEEARDVVDLPAAEPVSDGAEDAVPLDARKLWVEALDESEPVPDPAQAPVLLIDEAAELKVGSLALDPKKFPITAALASGVSTEDLITAMNQKIKAKVIAAMLTSQARRSAPVPLMLGQQQ